MQASSIFRTFAAAAASGTWLVAASCGGASAASLGTPHPFAVGSGAGCSHATLQAAITAAAAVSGPDTVVVTASVAHADQALLINDADGLTLAGGYADCLDTEASGTTVVDGTASASVVRILGTGSVTLQNLGISGGNASAGAYGGGVHHQGSGVLLVRDSVVRDNVGSLGGGIAVVGAGALTLVDSQVLDNAASGLGGGVYRNGTGDVRIERSTVGGNVASGFDGGGGVYFSGPGLLRIDDGTIRDNSADAASSGNGGGIFATAGDAPERPRLELLGATHLYNNRATNAGGGMYLRDVDLVADAGGTLSVESNRADGTFAGSGGGGLFLSGGSGRIGSGAPGALFLGNTSQTGGGGVLAADGADLRIFATDPRVPPAFVGNRANDANNPNSIASGGAVFADSESGYNAEDAGTVVLLYDVELRGNFAGTGGALAVSGFSVQKPSVLCLGRARAPESCAPYAAAPPANAAICTAGAACNDIADNSTSFNGSALSRIGQGGFLRVDGARIRAHAGNSLVFSSYGSFAPDGEELQLRDCLIDGNDSFGALFVGFATATVPGLEYYLGPVRIERCTIAGNTIAGESVFGSRAALVLQESIVAQPGLPVHAGHAGGVDARHVLAHEVASLPVRADVVAGDPLFVDPANGDFRPGDGSPALDFSDLPPGGLDLLGEPRGFDDPATPNRFGPRDLGAYERGPARLFGDGFEQPPAS